MSNSSMSSGIPTTQVAAGAMPDVTNVSAPVSLSPGTRVVTTVRSLSSSKTAITALVIILVGVLQQSGTIPELAQYQDLLVSLAGLLMVILRLVTNQPVALK